MRLIELREWQWSDPLALAESEIAELLTSDLFELAPHVSSSVEWRVKAKQHVGVAQIGSLEVRVEPKVPAAKLLSLLMWSQERIAWDDSATPALDESDDLVTVLAGAFCAAAEAVVRGGLLQGYRVEEDALPTVRGRMLVGAQMSRRAGMVLPVELRYDEFTVDVLENQLMAGACRSLLRVMTLPDGVRRRLRRLSQLLGQAIPTPNSPNPPSVGFTRLNDRYRSVVPLSRLVLRNGALDVGPRGGASGIGFMVDMNRVFEDIVGERLRSELEPQGLTVGLQDQMPLDVEGRIEIRPDILVRRGSEIIAVSDVKYKQADRFGVSTLDVYQVLAYASRFGLDEVGLIYASAPPYDELMVGDVRVRLSWVDLTTAALFRR